MVWKTRLIPGAKSLENLGTHLGKLYEVNPDEYPVIIILDPFKLDKFLKAQGDPLEANLRYDTGKKKFENEQVFELPVIETFQGDLILLQGINRTIYMIEKGINAVPYLTFNGMAPKIKSLVGTDKQPLEFDLIEMPYKIK